jgi:hypothetical protein
MQRPRVQLAVAAWLSDYHPAEVKAIVYVNRDGDWSRLGETEIIRAGRVQDLRWAKTFSMDYQFERPQPLRAC